MSVMDEKDKLAGSAQVARAYAHGAIIAAKPVGDEFAGDESAKEKMEYVITFSSDKRLTIFDFGDWAYDMTLEHGDGAINFARLNNKAPLLWMHDHRQPIGVIMSSWSEGGMGYARVKFSKNAKASEIKAMVDEGTLSKISVGFDVDQSECKKEVDDESGKETIHCVAQKWTPCEVSVVSVPMNDEVGIQYQFGLQNRSHSQKEKKAMNSQQNKNEVGEKVSAPVITQVQYEEHGKKSAENAVEEYRAYQRELDGVVELARRQNRISEVELAKMRRDVEDKRSPASELSSKVVNRLEELSKEDPSGANPNSKLGLTPKEMRKFSLGKAISYLMGGEAKESDIGFEMECSRAIRKKVRPNEDPDYRVVGGELSRVISIPYEIQQFAYNGAKTPEQRYDLDTGAASGGDHLIGEVHRADLYVPQLRDMAYVLQAGVRVIDGMQSELKIPRKTGAAAFSFKALDADTGTSDPTFDEITMSVKTASSGIEFSRMLRKLSNPSIEAIAMQDLVHGAALLIDDAVLKGSGAANNPTGVLNTTGIGSVTPTSATAITWAQIVEMETKLINANALPLGAPVYFMNPARKQYMKTTPKIGSTFPVFMSEGDMMNGYKMYCKTGSFGTKILLGIFPEVMLANWGIFELARDTATGAASGSTVLRCWIDIDVAVRHAASFVATSM